jgi:hypothetical protein
LVDQPSRAGGKVPRRNGVTLLWETAEKVGGRICRAVSGQKICLDHRSEGRRTDAWTSPFRVDRIAAYEGDFFSGLVDERHSGSAGDLTARHEAPVRVSTPRDVAENSRRMALYIRLSLSCENVRKSRPAEAESLRAARQPLERVEPVGDNAAGPGSGVDAQVGRMRLERSQSA